MTARLAVIALMLGALVVGCGGADTPSLSPKARAELEAKVTAAKAAAAVHDSDGARRELAATRTRIEALERQGQISHAQATAIHDSTIRVEGLLDLATTTTTLPPVVSEPDNGTSNDPGKGKGKGKGKD
jgi:hypothetical protein